MLSTLLVWSAWSFIVLGSVLLLLALTNSVLILLTDHDEVDMVKRFFTAGIILVMSGSGLIAENVTLSVILLLRARPQLTSSGMLYCTHDNKGAIRSTSSEV